MTRQSSQFREFEVFVRGIMEEEHAPGVAVGISVGNEVVYLKGFGFRNLEKKLPVAPETIFGVASVTKSFTGLASAKLAESGCLNFTDAVTKYIPEFDVPGGGGESITVHHLLTHTAGLPPLEALGYSISRNTPKDPDDSETSDPQPERESDSERAKNVGVSGEENSFRSVNTYADLVEFVCSGSFKMLGKPGEYCSYSNDGYALLGAIIETASGMPYDEYVQREILRPLEMSRSTFSLDEILQQEDVTSLYYKDSRESVRYSPHWQVAPPYLACGWLKSCARDLLNYVQMYAQGGIFNGRQFVSSESISRMIAPHHRYSRDRWYGYGFVSQPSYHGVTLVEHSGSLKGVASNVGFVPEEKISAVVLCNLTGFPAGKVWLAAVNAVLGLPLDTPRSVYKSLSWTKNEVENFTGVYRSGERVEIALEDRDGQIVAVFDKKPCTVRKDSDQLGVVSIRGQDHEVRFFVDEIGKTWAIGFGGRIIPRSTRDAANT